VEWVRNRCGACLARRNPIPIDFVAGIPDSGVGHGIGYAAEAGIPFKRPFVKYTPTWARSFMPQRLNLTTLKYQHLEDLVQAINLPWEKLCTYCWTGEEIK